MGVVATTDAEGNFEFKDLKGQDLGMVIVKPGYEYRRRSSSFSTAILRPTTAPYS